VPGELIESELFGHEKGAFTGAASRHEGKFEQARRGTLLLDEIGDMPAVMQAKLLRVLEEGEIERVGGKGPVFVDVRVLVATHRDLEEEVRKGTFRQDLFHRIYVFPIMLPPLRERKDDIPPLIQYFAQRISEANGWKPKPFTAGAVSALESYSWPGDVRELRNAVERLLLLANTEVEEDLVRMALAPGGRATAAAISTSGSLAARIETFERDVIRSELERNQHDMTATARALGLERSHFYKKCAHLGIGVERLRRVEE
jgi:two-component system nitrogen regulation response regulator NtrX